jgi:hypothetical protein
MVEQRVDEFPEPLLVGAGCREVAEAADDQPISPGRRDGLE